MAGMGYSILYPGRGEANAGGINKPSGSRAIAVKQLAKAQENSLIT